ncbi:MAG: DUF924 domain-containing protein [Desulfobacterales bacterium]|nr:DUF924 domain-containing protein [Desulfobacterales bacterium]
MYKEVLKFWFEETSPSQWWKKNDTFDHTISDQFSELHKNAARCELYEWRENALGRLAEIIILDQFSRNMFRGMPGAFAQDALALALAQEAVARGVDQQLNQVERGFLYLPYMHSESIRIHEVAVSLYSKEGMESPLEWELKHKKIIERFGRYPHRNEILGRVSSAEEKEFLKQPGSRF